MMLGGFRRHEQGSDSKDTHRDQNTNNRQQPDHEKRGGNEGPVGV
jgi:hypothetical protein